jgi:alpha-glucosidase
MRKVWVPKEALIPKPFYKQKLFVIFLLVLMCSVMFLTYQLYAVNQLQNSTEMLTERISHQIQTSKPSKNRLVEVNPKREILRGIRIRDIDNYTKIFIDQKFKCLDDGKEISWDRLNDDYCDCSDGSDETFTNAVSL